MESWKIQLFQHLPLSFWITKDLKASTREGLSVLLSKLKASIGSKRGPRCACWVKFKRVEGVGTPNVFWTIGAKYTFYVDSAKPIGILSRLPIVLHLFPLFCQYQDRLPPTKTIYFDLWESIGFSHPLHKNIYSFLPIIM